MNGNVFVTYASVVCAGSMIAAQHPAPAVENRVILDPAAIARPLADAWPTFAGDYTSRRFSSLKQVNTSNVKNLTLAWMSRVITGPRGGLPPTIIGGVGIKNGSVASTRRFRPTAWWRRPGSRQPASARTVVQFLAAASGMAPICCRKVSMSK